MCEEMPFIIYLMRWVINQAVYHTSVQLTEIYLMQKKQSISSQNMANLMKLKYEKCKLKKN